MLAEPPDEPPDEPAEVEDEDDDAPAPVDEDAPEADVAVVEPKAMLKVVAGSTEPVEDTASSTLVR